MNSTASEKTAKSLDKIIYIVAVAMGIFQLFTQMFRVLAPTLLQNTHLIFAYFLIFTMAIRDNIAKKRSPLITVFYVLCLAVSMWALFHMEFNYSKIINSIGRHDAITIACGACLIVTTIIAAKMTFGTAIPALGLVGVVYMFVGPYLPGIFRHGGFTFKRIIATLSVNFGGMYGTLLSVSATFLALFMIFGGLLSSCGGGEFFIDFALAIGGRFRAGPALAAVLSSALMGSINGSATANVATTGVFTIPLMKSRGYSKDFAGAVESIASTGGMILPPVMGVGAFVMAEITGIPYSTIALSAAIPAIIYYLLCVFIVILRSEKLQLERLPKEEIPKLWPVLKGGFYYLLPVCGIVYCMIAGYSVSRAGLIGIALVIFGYLAKLAVYDRKTLFSLTPIKNIAKGLYDGIMSTLNVAATLACIGLFVESITATGLANRLVTLILNLGGDNWFLCLLITMIVALIFGMGVPTTGSYIILAVMAAPALVKIGLPLLSVHLFIYYYTILGNITPPVGSACLVASRISDGSYFGTCAESMKMGISAFILPFIFVYQPAFLGQGSVPQILLVSLSALLGMLSLSFVFEKYAFTKLSIVEVVLFFACAVGLVLPLSVLPSLAAVVAFAALAFVNYRKYKKAAA